MSGNIKPKRRWLRWVLGGIALWIALVVLESQLIRYMDKQIRADRSIFVEYVDRLPQPIEMLDTSYHSFCEFPRVWGLWRYEICLQRVEYTNPSSSFPCPSPYFPVLYKKPNLIFFLNFPEWKRSILYLRQDKTVCIEHDITKEF